MTNLHKIIDKLKEKVSCLEAENAKLRKALEVAKAKLGMNSSNSSKPPSSDPPNGAGGKPLDNDRKRSRGGQEGHPRHQRALLSPESVTTTIEHLPNKCTHCNEKLERAQCDPEPIRHQIIELPKIEPDVTEHQCFSAKCKNCGKTTKAKLPADIQRDVFGPRMKAMVGLLGGKYRISKRGMVELLSDLFSVELALGSISKMEKFVSNAMSAPYEEIRNHVHSSDKVHADETSWRENKKKAWLWVASTLKGVLFMICSGRGKIHAQDLLGKDYTGIAHTDRWRGYDWIDVEHRQLCWAHLIRNFQGIVDRGGGGKNFGNDMLKLTNELFKQWHRYQKGQIPSKVFRGRMQRLRSRVRSRLHRSLKSGVDHVESMSRDLLRLEPAMWCFVYNEGVVPTNNRAEQDIRKGVLWRKVSFGTDSQSGSRFAERILTMSETCRKQKRNLFSFMTHLCEDFQENKPAPSLLSVN
ncbi:MAG TPA: IS66 family transposase [Flavobacteriales bacterium]|nr:IS66 family transposase [Flavobacteriales bacterium]HIB84809.1 IS66 family transposase [Chromatiaceae bacterium]